MARPGPTYGRHAFSPGSKSIFPPKRCLIKEEYFLAHDSTPKSFSAFPPSVSSPVSPVLTPKRWGGGQLGHGPSPPQPCPLGKHWNRS